MGSSRSAFAWGGSGCLFSDVDLCSFETLAIVHRLSLLILGRRVRDRQMRLDLNKLETDCRDGMLDVSPLVRKGVRYDVRTMCVLACF